MTIVDDLLKGSIDTHIHFGPDYRRERSVDGLTAAREAREVGMRAIVLKSHDYPTAGAAYVVGQCVEGIDVFGCICLDTQVGGLNRDALDVAGKLGARICWLPTHTAAHSYKREGKSGGIPILKDGKPRLLSGLATKSELVSEMADVFALVKQYDMILATGHISAEEVFASVDGARAAGVKKIVITHPLLKELGASLTVDQMVQLANQGAYIEHCFGATMPASFGADPQEIVDAVRKIGADRCVLSSDLGQEPNPKPAEGFRVMIATLLKLGLKPDEIETMIKNNPAKLLGLK